MSFWLEALTVYKGDVVKKTKEGEATYTCWFASWREGGKVKNVHLGSTKNMDEAAAMAKARKLKAEALGLEERAGKRAKKRRFRLSET
jgi:hypothetical protein